MPFNPLLDNIALEQAIILDPLTVSADLSVTEAIACMSAAHATCSLLENAAAEKTLLQTDARASCLLVIEENRLVGLLTERDVVRLSADGRSLTNLLLSEVMTQTVITLQQSEFTDIFAALHLLQRHHIRHLPVLDNQGQIVGLLTHETLRQLLRPVDLLRLRSVSEVMTSPVIHAAPETSVLEIARLMTEHRISSVVIAESKTVSTTDATRELSTTMLMPVGIVTEGDIVQFQALSLNFQQVQAQQVMSTPVFAVHSYDSLWAAQQWMQQKRLSRLIVQGDHSELLGIVTQSTLLQALNPVEIYKLVEVLEQKVCRLEAEKTELLEKQNTDLEGQVQRRTAELQKQAEREQLLSSIATHIRASLKAQNVLEAVVTEVQQFLQCDRVLVYQFNPDWSGIVVAESVLPGWRPALGDTIADCCFQNKIHLFYAKGQQQAVSDVYEVGYPDCYLRLLKHYQVKAKLVVPILVENQLWGLLIGHQCESDRIWEATDLELLDRIAVQLAIAIQQAQAYEQTQKEIAERRQAEEALRQSEATQQAIIQGIPDLLIRTNSSGEHLEFLSGGAVDVLYPSTENTEIEYSTVFDILPEPLANQRLHYVQQTLTTGQLQTYEQQLEINQQIRWEEVRISPLGNDEVLVIIRDITDRKQAEASLIQSEAKHRALISALPDLIMRMSGEGIYLDFFPTDNFKVFGDQDLIGVGIHERGLPLELSQLRMGYIQQALQTRKLQVYEQEISVDGETRTEEIRIAVCADDEVLVVVRDVTDRKQAEVAFQNLVEGAAAISGENFFTELVHYIAEVLNVRYVMVATQQDYSLQSAAFWLDGQLQPNVNYCIENTPCYMTVNLGEYVCPNGIQQQFPTNQTLKTLNAEAYVGVALTGTQGEVIGCLYIIDSKPLTQTQLTIAMLRVFAARVSAELERQAAMDALKYLNRELENRIAQRTIELRQSEERFRQIFEQSPVGIAISDLEGHITSVNSSLVQIMGYAKQDLLKLSIQDILSANGQQQGVQRLHQLLEQTLTVMTFESQFLSGRGEPVWVNVTSTLIFNAFGRPSSVIHLLEDVSERKQAEAQLLNLTSLQQAILNSTDYSIISTDSTGTIQTFNAAAQRMLGYTAEEVIGKVKPSLIHDQTELQEQAIALSQEIGRPIAPEFEVFITKANQETRSEEEWTYIRKDGSRFPVLLSVTALHDHQGNVTGYLGTSKDITQQKQAEAELHRTLKELSDFKYALDEATLVSITDAAGVITYANDRTCELSQYSREELIGKTHRLIKSGYHSQSFFTEMWETIADGRIWRGEIQNRAKDGAPYWLDMTIVPFVDQQGKPFQYLAISTDITARKRAELDAKSLEERLKFLLASSPAVIYTCQTTGEYGATSISENVTALLGYEPDEFLQDSMFWINHLHPDDRARVLSELSDLFNQGHYYHEYRFLHRDGTYRWMRDELRVIYDSEQNPTELIGYFADITDLKQAELDLQELSLSLQSAMEGISRLDKQGRYLTLNQAYAKLSGYEPEELVGKTWQTTVHPEDVSVMEVAYQTMLQQGKVETEARGIRKDGSLLHTQLTMVAALDQAGQFNGYYCFLKDISERKATEEALKRQLVAIEAAIDGIAVLEDGVYTFLNKSHLEIFGYEQPEELLGKSWQILYAPEEIQRIEQEVFPALQQQHFWQGEAIATRKDGSTFTEGLSLTVTENGVLICVCRDITEQKQVEVTIRQANDQLLLANAELARATRLKDEFLANMSHELRTPLNAILGMSEGLQEGVFGQINDAQERAITTIDRSGRHLLELINDILDLSKIESGKLELQIAPVSVKYLCETSLTFVRQVAVRKNIQLSTEIPASMPDLLVDERRIRQVLINLLNNAVKFTPDGGSVRLIVSQIQQNASCSILFQVYDTGIGIAPEEIRKLFQPFVQIDSSLTRQHTGTGLGLSLVQQLTQLHGGTVTVTSEVGKGSCFTVQLPYLCLSYAVPPIVPKQSVPCSSNRTILVIEDAPTAAEQTTRYLAEVGLETIVHPKGQGALATAIEVQPALILLDILLPDLPGWEVLTQLKLHPQTQNIPVIIASVMDERSRAIALGAFDYLVKPISRKQLRTVLHTLHLPITTDSLPQPHPTSIIAAPLILLAEDNAANVATISGYLKHRGFQLILAKDGEEAIALTEAHQPDLILMDIQMPKVDGFTAIQQIRANPAVANIPIIALTALAMSSDRERCIEAGVNEYMSKPVKLKSLVEMIHRLL